MKHNMSLRSYNLVPMQLIIPLLLSITTTLAKKPVYETIKEEKITATATNPAKAEATAKATTTRKDSATTATTDNVSVKSSSTTNDDEEVTENQQHQQKQCSFYIAESLYEPGSMSLYSGLDYGPETIIGMEEIVWPMILPNKNEYSPWQDFGWNTDIFPNDVLKLHSNEYSDGLISGLGMLTSCGGGTGTEDTDDEPEDSSDIMNVINDLLSKKKRPRPNIEFGKMDKPIYKPEEEDTTKKDANVTAGSFSNIYNYNFRTIKYGLRAGEELFLDCLAQDNDHERNNDEDRDSKSSDEQTLSSSTNRIIQDLKILDDKGICIGNIIIGPSTIPGGIGRGAFAKRPVSKGEIITYSPLLHFDRSQTEIVQQEYKEPDEHKIPLFRSHGIEYQNSIVLGHQFFLNYAFGHPDSNLLLLPMASGVNFINHGDGKTAATSPNAYIRWSSKLSNSSNLRENYPIMELLDLGSGSLIIEYVALRDVSAGEEILIDYGPEWTNAWEQHISSWNEKSIESERTPFRHEIGVPDGFYPRNWMRTDPQPYGDFIANPLPPGQMAPIRWQGTAKVVTPWAFRIGLHRQVREVLLDYCNKMGITDILRHVTVAGNGLEPGTESHMDVEGDDWYLQRPADYWRSNLHWFSPGAGPAHEHYLQALSAAGFDEILKGIGEYLGMDGLVAFHVTFIGVSHATKGFLHKDVAKTGAKVYNIIIPLILANETGPELDLQCYDPDIHGDDHADLLIGRYRYEYEVASMMGDLAFHATSACDYRKNKEMRMAATVYVADVNDENIERIMHHYTQAYPPNDDIELLRSWKGRHWKKGDPSRKLPEPSANHILVRTKGANATTTSEYRRQRGTSTTNKYRTKTNEIPSIIVEDEERAPEEEL